MNQDIDGFQAKNPGIKITLDLVPGFLDTFVPKMLALTAGNQVGDVTWMAPRHRSQIGWGVRFKIVRDLVPLAQAQNYDLKQFYPGALEHNSLEGKQYFMSYISEPIVPVIAYNKTKVQQMGQQLLAYDVWPFFIQILPDTYKGKFDVDFVLTPTVKKGDKRRSGLNEHVFGVTTASKNPDEAFKVVSWFGSKELNVQGVLQGQKGPIARPDFWADGRIG